MAEKVILISIGEYEQLLRKSCISASIPSPAPTKEIKQNVSSLTESSDEIRKSFHQIPVKPLLHNPETPAQSHRYEKGNEDNPPPQSPLYKRKKKKTSVIKRRKKKSYPKKKLFPRIPKGWVSW